ncbi:hypothetical protein [Trinickia fusca]|uniref:hypothetical protein n=1 Tax=Trinickia fusca TaxID=2419777 RepID=UPI00160004F3|nr:hypothetical protein [Trinickia fusca]
MQLALLVSQLPHVSEARAYYDGLLTLTGGPRVAARLVRMVASLQAALSKPGH